MTKESVPKNHSIRGFIRGTLTKKLGLTVESLKNEIGERTYNLLRTHARLAGAKKRCVFKKGQTERLQLAFRIFSELSSRLCVWGYVLGKMLAECFSEGGSSK